METKIALLRGINVGGNNKVSMKDLVAIAQNLGYDNSRTYINSGNLLFESSRSVDDIQEELQASLKETLALSIPVVVVDRSHWQSMAKTCPFTDVDRLELVMLALPQKRLVEAQEDRFAPYLTAGERVRIFETHLWIDFAESSARSKLTPTVIDRLTGSPTTTRNFRTVQKLLEF